MDIKRANTQRHLGGGGGGTIPGNTYNPNTVPTVGEQRYDPSTLTVAFLTANSLSMSSREQSFYDLLVDLGYQTTQIEAESINERLAGDPTILNGYDIAVLHEDAQTDFDASFVALTCSVLFLGATRVAMRDTHLVQNFTDRLDAPGSENWTYIGGTTLPGLVNESNITDMGNVHNSPSETSRFYVVEKPGDPNAPGSIDLFTVDVNSNYVVGFVVPKDGELMDASLAVAPRAFLGLSSSAFDNLNFTFKACVGELIKYMYLNNQ